MAQQTIIWNQRVLGRDVGDVETINTDTDLMRNLFAQGRVSLYVAPEPTFEQEVSAEIAKPARAKPEVKAVEPKVDDEA